MSLDFPSTAVAGCKRGRKFGRRDWRPEPKARSALRPKPALFFRPVATGMARQFMAGGAGEPQGSPVLGRYANPSPSVTWAASAAGGGS